MGLFGRFVVACMPLIPKPIVGYVAKPYVAGATLADAIKRIKDLNTEGAVVTTDVLGESVPNREKALEYADQYEEVLRTLEQEQVRGNISIKPTMLGLNLDEAFCTDLFHRLHQKAKDHGNWITIDMEDHPYTDATLRIYRLMQEQYGNSSTVLQAYMRRTLNDIGELPEHSNIRLCKGIYIEPPEIAWRDFHTVRENYIACLDKLIRLGHYAAIATHDDHLVWAGMEAVDRHGLKPDQYEFQMLLGVKPDLRKMILANGHNLRVYVPFGPDWYPYSTRRLRENPDVAVYIAKAFLGIR